MKNMMSFMSMIFLEFITNLKVFPYPTVRRVLHDIRVTI